MGRGSGQRGRRASPLQGEMGKIECRTETSGGQTEPGLLLWHLFYVFTESKYIKVIGFFSFNKKEFIFKMIINTHYAQKDFTIK